MKPPPLPYPDRECPCCDGRGRITEDYYRYLGIRIPLILACCILLGVLIGLLLH